MRVAVRAAVAAVAATVVTTTVLVAPGAGPAGASPSIASAIVAAPRQGSSAEEQAFVDRINGLRAGLGLPQLAIDPELAAQARIWAQTMKDAGNIFHTTTLDAGISADWEKLGENVGVGGTVDSLFDAFVASPKHYENLVDPAYRFIGVGVVWDGDRMFTAHRFMALLPPAPAATAAPRRPTPSPTPDELAAAEPTPTTVAPVPTPPPPVAPPASPDRISLVLATVDDLFS